MPTRAISLFSGAGGLDLGFEKAGFSIALANELDENCNATWLANRPMCGQALRRGDVRDILPEIARHRGSVEVVFGGPPCQGFSIAGKMAASDPRSALVFAFAEAVRSASPAAFVMENVPALAEMGKWATVRNELLELFSACGYAAKFHVLDASEFGVPQSRKRAFLVGFYDKPRLACFSDALESLKEEPLPVRDVLLSCGQYGTDENPKTCTDRVTLLKKPIPRSDCHLGFLVNGRGRILRLDGTSFTITASSGGNNTHIVDQVSLETDCENWFADYLRRLLDGKADPLTEQVPQGRLRRLTLKESAALQTFPSDYRFCGPKSSQYRQIGNAVPPVLAEKVALAVKEALS